MTDERTPKAKKWLEAITNAEKVFDEYNTSADRTEKCYADLNTLRATGDREFQIFWANMEILRPSVYQRAPQPVVMPRQTDLGPVARRSAEVLERALEYDIEDDNLHETLCQVRDDLCLVARGVPWVLDNGECIHVDRKDFLHEPARKWKEVTWVSRRAFLTREEGVERFGTKFAKVEKMKPGDDRDDKYGGVDEKCPVFEVWDKISGKVIWVARGCDDVLDEQDAFVNVKGFFPCPKPVYATLEPHTLKPVPDFAYYKDQAEEINTLTRRISALSESLRLKGYYPKGASDIGEAIEAAMDDTSDRAVLVGIPSMAALGGTSLKDSIVWLPVAEVAQTIQSLIELRKQLIADVYEITGISDIMRGETDAQETLGAQNLKMQNGSVRVREKQSEMARIAADVLRIKAEIMAETMEIGDLLTMASVQLPTEQQVQQQHMMAVAQAEASGQQPPPPPQVVTVEAVAGLLQAEKIRPFILEVETDSTIAPNEQAEKQARVEFLAAVGQFLNQAIPAVQAAPQTAPLMAEMLKFGVGAFRAGRDLADVIDQFAEEVKQMGRQQGQEPSPEAIKAQAEAAKLEADMQARQMDAQMKQAELQIRMQEFQAKQNLESARLAVQQRDLQTKATLQAQELGIKLAEMGIKQDDQRLKERQSEVDALLAVEEIKIEREQQRAAKIGGDD